MSIEFIKQSGWYVLYDGTPIAGPFKNQDQACRFISRKRDRDPDMTVEWLEKDKN